MTSGVSTTAGPLGPHQENIFLPPSIDLISKLLKGAEAGISEKFGSQFVHADFEAFAGWISISFRQKAFKRTWVGVKVTLKWFRSLWGPHEGLKNVVFVFWGHVNFTTRIRASTAE